jgi:inosine/xanthosine triphosphate pyrophosphatase family protein/dephospho-CoA kinase
MDKLPQRPTLREIFLAREKQFQVFFYTSSVAKYLHARVVFGRSGLTLHEFKSRREPYSEDYTAGKEALLARAVTEILGSVGSGSLFFVEDTSLRIDGLSGDVDDYPGLRVKEWFPEAVFEDVDSVLRAKGNRRAVVKSDIALHLPGLHRPVFFHGETAGLIAEDLPEFEENAQFPWLTPHSFNGWFVPDGAVRVLGQMSLEESWQFDFRTRALEQLITRIEEYTAILNMPVSTHVRRPDVGLDQMSLLPPPEDQKVFVIVGHTCAGKTTFGEYALKAGLGFVEASSILRMISDSAGLSNPDPFYLAQTVLERFGPDVVARKIIQLYPKIDNGIVLTGFRTIEELELFKKHVPHSQVVLIDASERTRFQRHLERGRYESVRSLEQFRSHDTRQWSLGLLRVAEDFADARIVNEGTMDEFYARIEALFIGREVSGISTRVQPRHPRDENQLFRCLASLEDAARPLSCDEIEEITGASGATVRHNNANKVLKRVPELARRLELEGTRVRYEITNAGRAYVRYMRSIAA